MNKNKLAFFVTVFTIACFLFSCQNSKQLAYFQDLTDTARVQLVTQYPYEPLKLQVDDQLQILVTSSSPEASQFFNVTTSTSASVSSSNTSTPYAVSPNGSITLPILGEMQVIGLTTQEVKQKIGQALIPYLKDAVVSVRIVNFKVTVIGEVTRPITVPVNGERINVLEAVGAAGDMTVYSKRYNVKVLRNSGAGIEVAHLNFNYSKLMQSPYFQLRQNDVVYIEPATTKGFTSERGVVFLPIILTLSTMLLTVLNLLTR